MFRSRGKSTARCIGILHKHPNPKYQKGVIKREREIKNLVQIIEPDARLQPWFMSDYGTLYDLFKISERELRSKLKSHFGKKLKISLDMPVWKLVDELKASGCL